MNAGALPPGFEFGTATAAYQIEGAVDVDGRGPCVWDGFLETRGHRGDHGRIAADHYHRWAEDVALLRDLGAHSYRLSASWSRVLPDGLTPNSAGLGFYDRLVDALLAGGVTPALTLYHMDLPAAVQVRGGWAHRETAERFGEYAQLLANRLGDRVKRWFTVNEPLYEAWLGYYEGAFPPAVVDADQAVAALHHLLLAHGLGYQALKERCGDFEVGPAIGFAPTKPATDHPGDAHLADLVAAHTNWASLDPIVLGTYPDAFRNHPMRASALDKVVRDGDLETIAGTDFLGINYYFPRTVLGLERASDTAVVAQYGMQDPSNVAQLAHLRQLGAVDVRPQADAHRIAGWAPYPAGLTESIVQLTERYGAVPILVTENGLPLVDYTNPEGVVVDQERIDFIGDHLSAIAEAVERGADVRAYYHWSLIDNLEWLNGYEHRFGLVHVDFATQRRTPKKSFHWYAQVIRESRSR